MKIKLEKIDNEIKITNLNEADNTIETANLIEAIDIIGKSRDSLSITFKNTEMGDINKTMKKEIVDVLKQSLSFD